MVQLVNGECTFGRCVEILKTLDIVAGIVKNQNRILVQDCGNDEICRLMPKPEKIRNNIMGIYFRDGKIYEYEGP